MTLPQIKNGSRAPDDERISHDGILKLFLTN